MATSHKALDAPNNAGRARAQRPLRPVGGGHPHEAFKQVVWEARVPPSPATPCLHEALRSLCPEHYSTATAAKRAVRRREVLVDGRPINDPSL